MPQQIFHDRAGLDVHSTNICLYYDHKHGKHLTCFYDRARMTYEVWAQSYPVVEASLYDNPLVPQIPQGGPGGRAAPPAKVFHICVELPCSYITEDIATHFHLDPNAFQPVNVNQINPQAHLLGHYIPIQADGFYEAFLCIRCNFCVDPPLGTRYKHRFYRLVGPRVRPQTALLGKNILENFHMLLRRRTNHAFPGAAPIGRVFLGKDTGE